MANISTRPEITERMALLVEGKDEKNFFEAMLRHLGIPGVFILDVGGNKQFHNKFPGALLYPGFRTSIKAYAIIRDAESSAEQAFLSVQNLLRSCSQPCPSARNTFVPGPPKVGVYIMPGNSDRGMLEDFCMETVKSNPVVSCVGAFIECIGMYVTWTNAANGTPEDGPYYPNNLSKARAKAFLAANLRDMPSVGVAALAGVWDFGHECTKSLRDFLLQLRV